ncbi:MAG: hypothetical protein IJW70_07150 [Clostridia bacterium]|nr:hypothetical protein [Clostridia bacterium]
MKKLSLLICACLLAMLVAIALVACDKTPEEQHTHTYADTWSSDEDGHWYAATCEHTEEKANTASHVDAENDGVCDVCSWGSDHDHTFAEVWSTDETNHWHASTCGHDVTDALESHKDEDNNGLCDVCEHSDGCEHPVSADQWLSDAEGHWHGATCKHTVKLDAAAHEDADNDGVCDVCAWFDESHAHTYKTEYTYDDQSHWFDADCGHTLKDSVQAHTDTNNDGACDTCAWNDGCTHAYSTLWSVDGTHHWHDVTCKHTIAPADQAEHTDADNNGACDVCDYLDHEHTYDTENWVYDASGHWHAASCGCSLKMDQTAHTDENNDGECDICDWDDGCEHLPAETWSFDNESHWHDVSCSHTIEPTDKSAHDDPDGDGACNVCGYTDASHTHTYENTLTVGLNTHYYASSCGHTGTRKDESEHVDEDGDDKCDVCGGLASMQILIDKATSDQSAAQIAGGTVVNTNTYHFSEEPMVSVENVLYEFGNGYLHTDDGIYQRWFTLRDDGTVFGARMIDGAYEAEDASGDNMLGYYFNGHFLYYNVDGYGVESLLYNLYYFALENVQALDGRYDAAAGAYRITFMYNNGFGSLYDVVIELKLSADYAIEQMRIYSVVYASFTEYEDGSAYPVPGSTPDYEYEVMINQELGARDAVNEHGPEVFLFNSYDFADENGTVYGDTIVLAPGDSVKLYFANVNPITASAKIDSFNISVNGNSSQIYQYLAWSGDYIYVKGIAAGTYTLTVESANMTKQVTIVVGTPELQSLTPQIYYKDYSGLFTSTIGKTYTLYAGQTLYFGAMANPVAADAGFTASASGGTLGTATISYGSSEIKVNTFTVASPGTYTITLNSTDKASVSTTLTVTVLPTPSVGDILNGSYMADIYDFNVSSYSALDILVTFAPTSAGASSGTVTITRNGSETEVLSYRCVDSEIVLEHISGDDLGYTLTFNDQYSVTIGWKYNDAEREQIMLEYNYTNRVYAEVWVSSGEMLGDMYRYTFVFGDQGYVFDGVNFTYPDLLSQVDNESGAITVTFLDSVADTELADIQSITFNPEANTISVVLPDRTIILTPDTGW